ncbi:metal-dependent transcriptional regulator [Calditerrivibrio sp.]|jgi:DtxR family Mn-dependent transcriptional regulator|uniref:metal-dependent transcriptional regulator n=1 Tax=Calditerrivibrio sp. TaxID=2792612 RepID=UPI003D0F4D5D
MDELTKSLEDYLEMILMLQKEHGSARVTDIAKRLNVKKPAVTNALKILSDKGLVEYFPYKEVQFTRKGKELAENLLDKHKIITRFFTDVLDVEFSVAEDDACKVEHVISEGTFNRLEAFLKFVLESDKNCIDIEKFKKECKN